MTGPRLLLPVADDSTLFFARAMRALLAPLPCTPRIALAAAPGALSDRQIAEALPEGPDLTLPPAALADPAALSGVDAIVTSRMVPAILDLLTRPRGARPAVLSFQGGLDFTPERAFAHRRDADVVFLVPRADIARYRAWRAGRGLGEQIVEFGHPAFLSPEAAPDPGRGDIWFFAQAVSPITRPARAHMVAVLAALARRHPDRTVWIKLRHLPGENRQHLHRERHPYPDLAARLPDPPENLRLTACSMAEALARAGRGITCTSTAAADLIAAGVPTQIHLDYVENYLDPLVPPMRRLFGGSGLIASLDEVLGGVTRAPDPDWLAGMFCPRDLGARVLAALERVRAA